MRLLKLFDIEIQHGYFADSTCPTLAFVPSRRTKRLAENQGLIFRNSRKGIAIYVEADSLAAEKAGPQLGRDFKLSFGLQSSDPLFLNYTALPLNSQALYYFHNLNAAGQSSLRPGYVNSPDGRLEGKLHGGEMVTDKDAIRVRPVLYTLDVSQLPTTVTQTLSSEVIGKYKEPARVLLNFEKIGEGWYTVTEENSIKEMFFATSFENDGGLIGILDIYGNSKWVDKPVIGADGSVIPQKYQINFAPRSTSWKYILKNKSKKKYAALDIEAIEGGLTFITNKQDQKNEVGNWVSFSREAHELKERQENYLRLIDQSGNGNGAMVLIERLPQPSAEVIKPSADKDEIISEVFVYI